MSTLAASKDAVEEILWQKEAEGGVKEEQVQVSINVLSMVERVISMLKKYHKFSYAFFSFSLSFHSQHHSRSNHQHKPRRSPHFHNFSPQIKCDEHFVEDNLVFSLSNHVLGDCYSSHKVFSTYNIFQLLYMFLYTISIKAFCTFNHFLIC